MGRRDGGTVTPKQPERGWPDGTHASPVSLPCRDYVPIVPVRYRNRTATLINGRPVQIIGVTDQGWLVGNLRHGALNYFQHEALHLLPKGTEVSP